MASPFASFANFNATFQVASGALAADSKGNLRPGKAIVEVVAQMDQVQSPKVERRPGIDSTAIFLGGTLISPQPLPSIITPDSPCAAVWDGRSGQFFLEFTAPDSILKSLGISFLDELRGWWQPGSFVIAGEPWEPSEPPTEPTDGEGTLRIPFSYGDASPKPIAQLEAGSSIFTATIVIQVPFNGSGASLQLGDSGQGDRLIAAHQVDPATAAEYEANPGHTYTAATLIRLAIDPGEGATQGSGFVLLEGDF